MPLIRKRFRREDAIDNYRLAVIFSVDVWLAAGEGPICRGFNAGAHDACRGREDVCAASASVDGDACAARPAGRLAGGHAGDARHEYGDGRAPNIYARARGRDLRSDAATPQRASVCRLLLIET